MELYRHHVLSALANAISLSVLIRPKVAGLVGASSMVRVWFDGGFNGLVQLLGAGLVSVGYDSGWSGAYYVVMFIYDLAERR